MTLPPPVTFDFKRAWRLRYPGKHTASERRYLKRHANRAYRHGWQRAMAQDSPDFSPRKSQRVTGWDVV